MATWHTCFGHLVDVLARALAGESINTTVELAGTVYEIRSTSLRAENGEITGVIGAATDFTERKRAEEEIKEGNRRLEGIAVLKADFTAMIAHELDTPLVVILGTPTCSPPASSKLPVGIMPSPRSRQGPT